MCMHAVCVFSDRDSRLMQDLLFRPATCMSPSPRLAIHSLARKYQVECQGRTGSRTKTRRHGHTWLRAIDASLLLSLAGDHDVRVCVRVGRTSASTTILSQVIVFHHSFDPEDAVSGKVQVHAHLKHAAQQMMDASAGRGRTGEHPEDGMRMMMMMMRRNGNRVSSANER